jgi:hypothetical protein
MSAIATMPFDYEVLPAETAAVLRHAAAAIKSILHGSVANVGQYLIGAKEMLEHGTFSAWAEAELGMNLRSVERYMTASRFLAGKPDIMSILPRTLVFDMAAPTAPQAVIDEVVAAAEDGKPLVPREIKAKLTNAKWAARTAKTQAAKSPEQIKKERQARESKAARQARAQRAEQEKQQRDEQERMSRLRPRAIQMMSTLDGGQRREVGNALDEHRDKMILVRLLYEIATMVSLVPDAPVALHRGSASAG